MIFTLKILFRGDRWQIYGGIGMAVMAICVINIIGLSNNSYMWTRVCFFIWPIILLVVAVRAAFMSKFAFCIDLMRSPSEQACAAMFRRLLGHLASVTLYGHVGRYQTSKHCGHLSTIAAFAHDSTTSSMCNSFPTRPSTGQDHLGVSIGCHLLHIHRRTYVHDFVPLRAISADATTVASSGVNLLSSDTAQAARACHPVSALPVSTACTSPSSCRYLPISVFRYMRESRAADRKLMLCLEK